MGSGMLCPKDNADAFTKEHEAIILKGMFQDVNDNGIDNIIKRELNNYEAYYTGDITDTVNSLAMYGITEEQIKKVYGTPGARQSLQTNYS